MNTLQQSLFTATPYDTFRLPEQDTTPVVVASDNDTELPSLRDVKLPDDHPLTDLYTAPSGYGPGLYPGFVPMAEMLEQAKRDEAIRQMTPAQIADVWNTQHEHGGTLIRWDETTGEFVTRDGTAYSVADVESTVKGLLRY